MDDHYDQYPPQYPRSSRYSQGGSREQYPPQYQQGGQVPYPPQYPPYPQRAPQGYQGYPGQVPHYGQGQGRGQGRVATQARVNVTNPYASRALVYGILSIVAVVVALFTDYLFIGAVGLYAIYYAIKGMSYSRRLPGNKGLTQAIIGLILSVIGVLATIGLIVLLALDKSGALN